MLCPSLHGHQKCYVLHICPLLQRVQTTIMCTVAILQGYFANANLKLINQGHNHIYIYYRVDTPSHTQLQFSKNSEMVTTEGGKLGSMRNQVREFEYGEKSILLLSPC